MGMGYYGHFAILSIQLRATSRASGFGIGFTCHALAKPTKTLGGAPPPGGEAPSPIVDLVMSVRPCIHPKP